MSRRCSVCHETGHNARRHKKADELQELVKQIQQGMEVRKEALQLGQSIEVHHRKLTEAEIKALPW